MSSRESLAIDDQADDHLFAVGAMVAGIASLGFGVEVGLALKIGAGQVVEQDRVVEVEQGLLTLGQSGFDRSAVGVQAVEVSIERILGQL